MATRLAKFLRDITKEMMIKFIYSIYIRSDSEIMAEIKYTTEVVILI